MMSTSSASSSSLPLSTYSLEKLLQLWRREELTVEQAVGHLLQHLATLETQSHSLQKQVQSLQQAVSRCSNPSEIRVLVQDTPTP